MSVRFPTEEVKGMLDGFLSLSTAGHNNPSHLVVWRHAPGECRDLVPLMVTIGLVGDSAVERPSEVFSSVLARAMEEVRADGKEVYLTALFVECYTRPLRRTHPLLGHSESPRPRSLADAMAGFVPGGVKGHADACETVMMYGADADGRRFRATRYLTGPQEGRVDGIWSTTPHEAFNDAVDQHAPIGPEIRKAVGARLGTARGKTWPAP